MGADGLADVGPDGQEDALAFVVAGTIGMGLAEVSGRDGAVNSRDDLGQADVLGGAGQDVTAPDAPFGTHQARPFEGQQNLLEIRLGQSRPLGYVAHGCRRLGAVQGE